jgi:hypothetical protein
MHDARFGIHQARNIRLARPLSSKGTADSWPSGLLGRLRDLILVGNAKRMSGEPILADRVVRVGLVFAEGNCQYEPVIRAPQSVYDTDSSHPVSVAGQKIHGG